MQHQIRDVVACRVRPPQSPFQPEGGIGHRPVVSRFRRAPEPVQAVRCLEEIVVGVQFVVHDEPALQGRVVRHNGGHDQQDCPSKGRKVQPPCRL